MLPTNTDSSIFIRILHGTYGYMETMLHYVEECSCSPHTKGYYSATFHQYNGWFELDHDVSVLLLDDTSTEASGSGYTAGGYNV